MVDTTATAAPALLRGRLSAREFARCTIEWRPLRPVRRNPARGDADLSISVYTSIDAIETLWRRACTECSGFVFQTHEWQSAYQATIGGAEGVSPYIVQVADRTGRTRMLLPLGIHRERGLRVLRFLGGVVTDYNAPVIAPGFAGEIGHAGFAALWERILAQLPAVDL